VIGSGSVTIRRAEPRRGGVGRLLVSAAEGWIEAQDAVVVGLATRRASDFWLAIGYEESATYFRKLL
jgi:hypothetical protein